MAQLDQTSDSLNRDPEIAGLLRQLDQASGQKERLRLSLELGRRLAVHGAYERVIEFLEPVLPLAEAEDDRVRILRQLGEANLRLSRYQRAYMHLGEALTLLSSRPGSVELFQVYYDIAWMFYRQGYLDNARSYLDGARMALEGMPEGGAGRQQAELLHITGLIEAAAGNHDLAAANLQMEAGIHRKAGDDRWLAAVYNKLSSVTYARGDIAGALEHQALTHSLAERIGDDFRLALSHKNYGDIYFIAGDLPAALSHYRRSEDICRSIGNGLGQVFALAAIGRILAAGGEDPGAKSHFDQALEKARELELRDREACILVDLAEWHCLQNRPEAAQESLRLAGNIEMMRGQTSSPRHRVVLARSLLMASGIHGAVEAQRLLENLLSRPLKIDDEQMTAVPELEAMARFLLSQALSKQGLSESAAAEKGRAVDLLEGMVVRMPEELRRKFLAKPEVSAILPKGG